ncbi:CRTAC1 family protein [Micromonospora sp. BRA006-A]|nr:CRTAC1 family protein [Micromonospora sp. BRA006-A]
MANDTFLKYPWAWPNFRPGDSLSGHERNPFFVRGPNGRFVDVSKRLGMTSTQASRAIAVGDVDHDGRLDMAVANQWAASELFRNTGPTTTHLGLRLVVPTANGATRAAIGARVEVRRADGTTLTDQLYPANGHTGVNADELYFGLGGSPSAQVRSPGATPPDSTRRAPRSPRAGTRSRYDPSPDRGENHGQQGPRIVALRRFALSITVFTLLGHTVLGFEQSWLTPIAALLTAYALELLLEDARGPRRAPPGPLPRLRRRSRQLPAARAHRRTGLRDAALRQRAAVAHPVRRHRRDREQVRGAGALHRRGTGEARPQPEQLRHRRDAAVLHLGGDRTAVPVHREHQRDLGLGGARRDPGRRHHAQRQLTRRGPLVAAWVAGFAAQAVLRSVIFDHALVAALLPMTGVAFVLFTNYMITDPGTTRTRRAGRSCSVWPPRRYGTLVLLHIEFGLFFALTTVCAGRWW